MTFGLTNQNNTNFPISVKNGLEKIIKEEYKESGFLKYYQFIVQKYLINNELSRGILIFHEMGFGKSITAVSIAEYYRKNDPNRNIVVLLSKSLQANLQKNIEKFIKINDKIKSSEIDDIIKKRYKFISLNASNMFSQISKIKKTQTQLEIETQIKEFVNVVERQDFLENSVLIIDEFHNLSNSITNGSSNAIKLYDVIMKTKNIKLIFLSGTPIINNPFELVPTFNMLRGKIKFNDKFNTLFPESQKDFNEFFIDRTSNSIKNADKFKNRIFGLVSYYGSIYFGNKQQKDFPKELKTIVEKIPMSANQFSKYISARDIEKEESSYNIKRSKSVDRFASKSSSSSYRMKSRQVSNYLIPEYALGPKRGKRAREKFIEKIKDSDLEKLNIFSPKIEKIMENVKKHKKQLGLIYSEFVSAEGLGIISRILESRGYVNWNMEHKITNDMKTFDMSNEKKYGDAFALITGDVTFDVRNEIIKIFNSKENKYGDLISLLLISKTGAEGLNLKNIRHVHITEPYWNIALINQIIARAVRYKSHEMLPSKEQTVQPYIYLSDYPKDVDLNKFKELTTDVQLYTDSIKNKKLINDFLIALAESSIDCSIHSKDFEKNVSIKCKMCSPNDKELYNSVLKKQIMLPNPCEEIKKEKIKAFEISILGDPNKYMYSKISDGKYQIYIYNENIQGFTIMNQSNPTYSIIMKKILKL